MCKWNGISESSDLDNHSRNGPDILGLSSGCTYCKRWISTYLALMVRGIVFQFCLPSCHISGDPLQIQPRHIHLITDNLDLPRSGPTWEKQNVVIWSHGISLKMQCFWDVWLEDLILQGFTFVSCTQLYMIILVESCHLQYVIKYYTEALFNKN